MQRLIFYILLSTLASVWSCRKDVDTFRPYGSSTAEIESLLAKVPNDATVTIFDFSGPLADTVLTTAGGVRVSLTDTDHLLVDANGTPVAVSACGVLQVEITEALRSGDILALDLPTSASDGQLLESGGMVRVRIFCDGQPLELAPDRTLKIQITTAQDDLKPDMLVFAATVDNQENFTGWENTGQEIYFANWVTPQGGKMGYELIVSKLGWVNCSRPIDEQTSSFCVSLPLAFNPDNSAVYLVFKNQRTVTKLEYDLTERQFCLEQAPIGYLVQVVSVSKTGNQYWLGNYETETGSNSVVSFSPVESTEGALLTFLKNL